MEALRSKIDQLALPGASARKKPRGVSDGPDAEMRRMKEVFQRAISHDAGDQNELIVAMAALTKAKEQASQLPLTDWRQISSDDGPSPAPSFEKPKQELGGEHPTQQGIVTPIQTGRAKVNKTGKTKAATTRHSGRIKALADKDPDDAVKDVKVDVPVRRRAGRSGGSRLVA
jgi:hypothetical protein